MLIFVLNSPIICDLRVAVSGFLSYSTLKVLIYFYPVGMQVLSPSIACP